jgi:hypothetical protein
MEPSAAIGECAAIGCEVMRRPDAGRQLASAQSCLLYLIFSPNLGWRARAVRKRPRPVKNSRIEACTTAVSDGLAS